MLGTSQVLHCLCNLGLPIAPAAGTDAYPDFHRSMAIGSTGVYVRPEGRQLDAAGEKLLFSCPREGVALFAALGRRHPAAG